MNLVHAALRTTFAFGVGLGLALVGMVLGHLGVALFYRGGL